MNLFDTAKNIKAIQNHTRGVVDVSYTHRGCKVTRIRSMDAMDFVQHEQIVLEGGGDRHGPLFPS